VSPPSESFIGDYLESTLLLSGKKPGGNIFDAGPDIFLRPLRRAFLVKTPLPPVTSCTCL